MLKYFISQNVSKPSEYNVAYYLGPYFEDDYGTNHLDGETSTPTPAGYYWGIDFVEAPTDIYSLIFTHRNVSSNNSTGVGYGGDAIQISANDDYSYLFILPTSYADFYNDSFNLNTDTEIEILHGGTNYRYKFIPSYNGRFKSSEANLYFPNFPYESNNGEYLESIALTTSFGQTFPVPGGTTVYPHDMSEHFYDNSVSLFMNRPTETGLENKADNTFNISLEVGNYPLVYEISDIDLKINNLDAYGNILSTNVFTLNPSQTPAKWELNNGTTVSSRIQVHGEMNMTYASYLMYMPIYKVSTDVDFAGNTCDIQIYNGSEMLWSYKGSHGQYWIPNESNSEYGYYVEDEIPNVVVDYDYLYTLEGMDWTFKLVDSDTDEVLATCDFTVSYSSSDSQPEIIFE